MTRILFVFIASFFLLLPFVQVADTISTSLQFWICTPFIVLLGIPHGAIDNTLYYRKTTSGKQYFILVYVLTIVANAGLWIVFPRFAYIVFLLISAFHFGQSQFTHYLQSNRFSHNLLYLFWGSALLSGLIYFNLPELAEIGRTYSEFGLLESLHPENITTVIFGASILATLGMLSYLAYTGQIKMQNLLMELLILFLVLVSFALLPLLPGFTLYFVILHSAKVLREEFHYLKDTGTVQNTTQFVKLLFPFSLLSIVGIIALYALIYFGYLQISYAYCLLIVISSITLPHVYVMNKFYEVSDKATSRTAQNMGVNP